MKRYTAISMLLCASAALAMSCGGNEPEPKGNAPVVIIDSDDTQDSDGDRERSSTGADPTNTSDETPSTGTCEECPAPGPWCDGDLRKHVEVTCDDGTCALGDEISTDCAATGQVCDNGACVDEEDGTDPNACTCHTAPPSCRGTVLRIPQGTATCDPSTRMCSGETYDEVRCEDSGQVCANGSCVDRPKRAFLTAALYDGDLLASSSQFDGAAAADELCQLEADGAGMGGTFKAWISTISEDAIDRIANVGPWYLVDNATMVANNTAELVTSGPRADITMHPNQSTQSNFGAWTGTNSAGRWSGADCNGWSTDNYQYQGQFGVDGGAGLNASNWTDWTDGECGIRRHLYCFEQ